MKTKIITEFKAPLSKVLVAFLFSSLSPCISAVVAATENGAAPGNAQPAVKEAVSLPGYEPFVFRKVGESELRLHVIKPKGWKASDRLPCLIGFFGGGWDNGDPTGARVLTTWAVNLGMVGVAPDYRTRTRYGAKPEDCVSDGRAAVRWVQAHAAELGVDPAKVICAGISAGGHVAAWTAISGKGPGIDDPGAPQPLPMALVLLCPVTNTTDIGFGGSKRFEGSNARAKACSVTDCMSAKMPPTIVFHGTEDKAVPYANSKEFHDKMVATGNRCELVTFENLGHMYFAGGKGPEGAAARQKTEKDLASFLSSIGFSIPAQLPPSGKNRGL